MNDREQRRYDMFTRVQAFGVSNAPDFAAGSKASTLFSTLAQIIKDLDKAKAGQQGGSATAKAVLLDALRLDVQNIARTARSIDDDFPGFADNFKLPIGSSQAALLTVTDTMIKELADAGVAARFIAYELPADFVQDLIDDRQAIADERTALESKDNEGVESTATVGQLIKQGMTALTALDAIMYNKYTRDSAKLRAWQSASHTERAPQREKASTPPAGPAALAATG